MRRVFAVVLVLAASAFLMQSRLAAHHSFSSEFDQNAPIELEGTLTKFEWVNPHAWAHIDVKDPKTGQIVKWMVEGGAPNNLLRRGWTKQMLPFGARIHIEGYRARDRSQNRANGHILQVLKEDGPRESFFMGSSGTGAPYEKQAQEVDQQGRPVSK
jgi:hypothetical protein